MTIPTLLIPGLGCTPEIWSGQLPALWTRGPITIADHTQGDSVNSIATSILETAPPSFALAGISMGGYIAFEIWRRAPHRVRGLALFDTQASPDTPEATAKRRDAIALVEAGKFGQVLANAFPLAVHPDHVGDDSLRSLHRRMSLANGPDVYIAHQNAIIARPDSRPDLPGITVPTAVVVGIEDRLTPPALSREMADAIPHAALEVVDNAGHLALVEQPAACAEALLRWLSRIS